MRMLLVLTALALPVAAVEIDLATAVLTLDGEGRVERLVEAGTGRWLGVAGTPFCELDLGAGWVAPVAVGLAGARLWFEFPDGVRVDYALRRGDGYVIGEVTGIAGVPAEQVRGLRVAQLRLAGAPKAGPSIVAGYDERSAVGLLPLHLGVRTRSSREAGYAQTMPGVRQDWALVADAERGGRDVARFGATSYRTTNDGWAVRGLTLERPLDLTGLRATRLWVRGDGSGQALKIQLLGDHTVRDDVVVVDWEGWREVTLATPHLNTLDTSRVTTVNIYYNSLPPERGVEVRLDDLRAVVGEGAAEREVSLVDFSDPRLPQHDGRALRIWLETTQTYGVLPAGFGLLVAPSPQFTEAIAALQVAAGLPSPRPGGLWNKTSAASERSYLFIFAMHEDETPLVIDWAERGGFATVLLGETWSTTHGHHEVNKTYFPDGLPSLQRSAAQFHEAGMGVGLHFLCAAVYASDPYVTPVPDPRLVTNGEVALGAAVDAEATELPLAAAPPESFPAEDGGYMGDGRVVWIGDELIEYRGLRVDPPALLDVRRGHHGTTPAAHAAGAAVRHLERAYGYYLFDLHSTLADEVTGNVAAVANAIGADMLYLDGAERTQGEHWWDNGRLADLYWRGLDNPNTLIQASSWGPWSWHIIGRMASADGHGDVKGYLDARTPGFASYDADLMPLDCGWYYLYDRAVTADQFDYILQRCLGFGASLSLQTNPTNLREHPEAPAIFELARTYEQLRLSGLVDEATRAKLREPKREYRLRRDPLRLTRTHFGDWAPVALAGGTAVTANVSPAVEGARLGLQLRGGSIVGPGAAAAAAEVVMLEPGASAAPYSAGSTSAGVTQALTVVPDGGPEGGPCLRYTATSTAAEGAGWSMVPRSLTPAVDLSGLASLGFWMRGDGGGGSLKVQLRAGGAAADWYIANDREGWRWVQLLLVNAILTGEFDWAQVDQLQLYYNGLPGAKTVSVALAGLRAMPGADHATLVNPTVTVGGARVTLHGTIGTGERLVWFPSEAAYIMPASQGPAREVVVEGELPALDGPVEVVLSADATSTADGEVRWVQEGTEELPLPEEALGYRLEGWR